MVLGILVCLFCFLLEDKMTIPSQPLSLSGKLSQWIIAGGLVVFFWVTGLLHLAELESKYHDSPLFQDLGVTWFGTGVLTILIVLGLAIINLGMWARKAHRWHTHLTKVAKMEKQNHTMRHLLAVHGIRFS